MRLYGWVDPNLSGSLVQFGLEVRAQQSSINLQASRIGFCSCEGSSRNGKGTDSLFGHLLCLTFEMHRAGKQESCQGVIYEGLWRLCQQATNYLDISTFACPRKSLCVCVCVCGNCICMCGGSYANMHSQICQRMSCGAYTIRYLLNA